MFLYSWAHECFVSIYLSVNKSSWMKEARGRDLRRAQQYSLDLGVLPVVLLSQDAGCCAQTTSWESNGLDNWYHWEL